MSSPNCIKQHTAELLLNLDMDLTSETHRIATPPVSPLAAGSLDTKVCDLQSWYDSDASEETCCSQLSSKSTNTSVVSFDLSHGDEDDTFDTESSYVELVAFYIGDEAESDDAERENVVSDDLGFVGVENVKGVNEAITECCSDGKQCEFDEEEDNLSELSDLDEDYINGILNADSDDEDDVLYRKFDDIAYDVTW